MSKTVAVQIAEHFDVNIKRIRRGIGTDENMQTRAGWWINTSRYSDFPSDVFLGSTLTEVKNTDAWTNPETFVKSITTVNKLPPSKM